MLQLNSPVTSWLLQVHQNPGEHPSAVLPVLSLLVPSRCSQGTYVSDVHAGKLSRPVPSSFVEVLHFFMVLKNIFICVFIESPSSILDAVCVQVGNSANTICVWFADGALLQ